MIYYEVPEVNKSMHLMFLLTVMIDKIINHFN